MADDKKVASKKVDEKAGFQLDLAKYLSEKDFVYGPEPELYTPVAGFYSYGLVGKAMKNNIENTIRKVFTQNNFFGRGKIRFEL